MQYGALPELHGQNILLSFEEGHVQNAYYVIMILSEFINHGLQRINFRCHNML